MKVRIELDDSLDEMEVIIRAPELDLAVTEIQQALT